MSLLDPGQVFANRFEIDREAGSGGMGTVYRARDRYSGEFVALKLLHGGVHTPEEIQRFAREAQLLAELRHPGIVSYISDGLTADGQRFLAMEWLDGESLGDRLGRGPLSLRDAIELLRAAAAALSAAHQRGIVHRDIKPSNLFVPGGQIEQTKILDFGVARRAALTRTMTMTGVVLGTPGYMAPEQARGTREVLPAADIFSLGCVLYECLAGEAPFAAEHVPAVLMRILFEEPVPIAHRRIGLPEPVVALLDDMLKKEPSRRLADAMTLQVRLDDLRELPDNQGVPTAPMTPSTSSRFAESQRVLFTLVMAADPRPGTEANAEETLVLTSAESERQSSLLAAVRALGAKADFMADGALVATVSRTGSATDQVAIAARAALLIKERWPEAVVTVATGRGSAEGSTSVGALADQAVRQHQHRGSEAAEPLGSLNSGVWVDALSARLLGPRFTLIPTADGAVLTGEEKEADESRRLLGKPTPCIGRDAELAMLAAQLDSCCADLAARLMLVTAPPGLGKSRLRHEFLRRVERSAEPVTLIDGRGELMSAGAPYGILANALRRLCDITGSEPNEEQQRRLRDRVAQKLPAGERDRVTAFLGEMCHILFPDRESASLRAARQDPKLMRRGLYDAGLDWLRAECGSAPVLFLLDDLQWADALTVVLLEDALHQLTDAPLFVLAFARPEVHEVFPKLRAARGMQEYQLKPLSKRSCERLVQQILGPDISPAEVAQAIEQAAGNALFLEEIMRCLAEGKPAQSAETVIAMLQARLGRMAPGPGRVARAAAVLGQTFWRGGVAALLGMPPMSAELESWLGVLVQQELIVPHPTSRLKNEREYVFRSSLIRDAGYSLLTKSDLLTGHRLAAAFLAGAEELHTTAGAPGETMGETPQHREALAYHYERAEMYDAARDTLVRDGEAMLRLGALSEARVRYTAALAMVEQLPDSESNRRCKVDVLLRLVQTGMLVEKAAMPVQRLELAAELLSTFGDAASLSAEDRLRLARLDYLYGQIHYYRGQGPAAIGYYRKVLPIAQEFGDQELLAIPSYMIGAAMALRGYTNEAEPLLAQAIEPLARYGEQLEWLRAVLFYGHALLAKGHYVAGRQQLDRAHDRAVELKNPELVVMSYAVRCSFFRTCGDWPETVACADQTVELAERLGTRLYVSLACAYRAWARSYLGQTEEAAKDRARALEVAAALGTPTLLSSWFAAADCEIALHAGRYAWTCELAAELLPKLRSAGEFLAEKVAERALAVARAVSEPGASDEPLAASVRALSGSGNLVEAARTHVWWGRVGLLRGDRSLAREHHALAAAQFADAGCSYAQAEAQRLLESVSV